MVEYFLFLPKILLVRRRNRAVWRDLAILVAHQKVEIELPLRFVTLAGLLASDEVTSYAGDEFFLF